MPNFLADLGRGGGISPALENLADRARQMRMDEEARKDNEFNQKLAVSKETRAVDEATRNAEMHNLKIRETAQNININKQKLAEAQQKFTEENKVIDATGMMNKSPMMFKLAQEQGLISTSSDGTPYYRAGAAKDFFKETMNKPAMMQALNVERRNMAKQQMDNMRGEVEMMREKLTKKGVDPRTDQAYMAKAQEYAALNDQYQQSLQLDADLTKSKTELLNSGKYTPQSVERWYNSGNASDLVMVEKKDKENGYGGGLKSSDENLILKTFAQLNGGVYDESTGTFSGLSKDKQSKVVAGASEAARLVSEGKYNTLLEASAAVARKQGFPVENLGEVAAQQATEDTGQPAAVKTKAEYDALPKGALFIDPGDGKTYRKK